MMLQRVVRYTKTHLENRQGLKTPRVLIHFVTTECNMRCGHCFYWKELGKKQQFTLEEAEKMIRSLKHPLDTVDMAGGEPFMYPHIVKLCEMYSRINRTRGISIPTNGFLTEDICRKARAILERIGPHTNLHVQISLDGLEESHEHIRNMKNSFRRAFLTVEKLKEIQARDPRLSINVVMVVTSYNYQELDALAEKVNSYGADLVFEIVRGVSLLHNPKLVSDFDPKDEACVLPPMEKFDEIYSTIKRIYYRQYKAGKMLSFPFILSLAKIKHSFEILKNPRKIVDCLAGSHIGVVYPTGEVSVCEFYKPAANIRETDFDFERAWNSPAMGREKEKVKGCYCTHGCFLQSAMYYNPYVYGKLIMQDLFHLL